MDEDDGKVLQFNIFEKNFNFIIECRFYGYSDVVGEVRQLGRQDRFDV